MSKTHTPHTERKKTLGRVSVSDTPFYRTIPLFYQGTSLFMRKFWTPPPPHLFGQILKVQPHIHFSLPLHFFADINIILSFLNLFFLYISTYSYFFAVVISYSICYSILCFSFFLYCHFAYLSSFLDIKVWALTISP